MRVFYRLITPLIALAATACGATPTNDQTIPETPEPAPVVSAAPTTPGAPGMPGDRTLVLKAQAAFQVMQGYQAELNYMQKMGAKTSRGIYDIAGRKPRKLRIHIKQGTGEGAKLLWEGGRKLKVRAGGLLTIDYAATEDVLYRQFACGCGAAACRRWITGRAEAANAEGREYLAGLDDQ